MKLEVHERIALLQLLPTEGTYAGIKAIRRAREMISFQKDEIDFYKIESGVRPDGSSFTNWDPAKAMEQIKDVPVDEYVTDVIRKSLAELEVEGKLNDQTLSLYEKFVVMYQ
ncbi:MAG: hypothetical protein ACXAB9_12645 [Candidatus Thorarchaeota archaeon]|jgi:hypothetical protein